MAVEINEYIPNVNEKPRVEIKSDKFKQTFMVQPQIGGFVFYEIRTTTGPVPEELKGKYTRMSTAVEAVKRYEQKQPKSKAVQRDEYAAKVQRKGTKHVREGADHGEG